MSERNLIPFAAGLLLLFTAVHAQDSPAQSPRIEVVLERMEDSRWVALDARTVLDSGDRIRFRFLSTIPGWLYVHYIGAGGESAWLVPRTNEQGHRIVAGDSYNIPGGTGSYTVAGPPGFDVVYWILSPKPVPADALLPPAAKRSVPQTLIPRCRGEQNTLLACLDDRAGPAAVSASGLATLRRSNLRPRELKIDQDSAVSTIEPADRTTGIIMYEFRLAHR